MNQVDELLQVEINSEGGRNLKRSSNGWKENHKPGNKMRVSLPDLLGLNLESRQLDHDER